MFEHAPLLVVDRLVCNFIKFNLINKHTLLENFNGLLDCARHRIGYPKLANEVNIDMLLFLILDRNAFSQNVVNKPFKVHFTRTNNLLQVLKLGLEIVFTSVIANKLDIFIVSLGWQLLWVFFN